ncbi:hypothetical protein NPIL_40601 [Nephila pilipes]|uniref:Uncharacterized protein n=1 Tax=Nephila pilipes TaxID=299642 RepID=A0A8X6U6K6_NEPPI|nr:hypothetical protein NPIL_40601 [Nephila pilipes]
MFVATLSACPKIKARTLPRPAGSWLEFSHKQLFRFTIDLIHSHHDIVDSLSTVMNFEHYWLIALQRNIKNLEKTNH